MDKCRREERTAGVAKVVAAHGCIADGWVDELHIIYSTATREMGSIGQVHLFFFNIQIPTRSVHADSWMHLIPADSVVFDALLSSFFR